MYLRGYVSAINYHVILTLPIYRSFLHCDNCRRHYITIIEIMLPRAQDVVLNQNKKYSNRLQQQEFKLLRLTCSFSECKYPHGSMRNIIFLEQKQKKSLNDFPHTTSIRNIDILSILKRRCKSIYSIIHTVAHLNNQSKFHFIRPKITTLLYKEEITYRLDRGDTNHIHIYVTCTTVAQKTHITLIRSHISHLNMHMHCCLRYTKNDDYYVAEYRFV